MTFFVLKHKTKHAGYVVSFNSFSTSIQDALVFQSEHAAENFAQLQEDMNRGGPLAEDSTDYIVLPYF